MSAPNAPRKAALAFILITVFLDVLSFGLVIPVLPHLIAGFYDGDQGLAVKMNSYLSSGYWLLQFLTAPLLGALSDQFGRRIVLLGSNLGTSIDFMVMAVASSLPILAIGRALSGLTSASFSTAGSYIADVTPPEQRAAGFGMMGAAFGVGFIVGPALGGYLGAIDHRLPFWVAAGLSMANFLYGWLVLPESLKPELRRPVSFANANPLGAFLWLKAHPALFGLVGVVFLSSFAHVVYPSTFVLYADYRYGWDEKMVGYTLAAVGVLGAIVQGGLIKRAVAMLGERRMVLLGLACGVLGFAGYGWAPTAFWFWMMLPIMAIWGLANPGTQSLMTRQVPPYEQGRLQGALSSISSLANIFGPLVFGHVFAAFVHSGPRQTQLAVGLEIPGAAFYLASLVLLSAFLLAWRVARPPANQAAG